MYVVDSLCSFEEANASHLYSYKHGFKGFAPKLTDDQALQISIVNDVGFMIRIWPESPSFSDSDMPPGLAKWKGICQSGEAFNASNCNRVLESHHFSWWKTKIYKQSTSEFKYYKKAYEAALKEGPGANMQLSQSNNQMLAVCVLDIVS
ncbi:hypothetical protein L1887_05844 [Cichorium endivia]|nr:hypothetical protein L1887_05844 [Cichorium endivia]